MNDQEIDMLAVMLNSEDKEDWNLFLELYFTKLTEEDRVKVYEYYIHKYFNGNRNFYKYEEWLNYQVRSYLEYNIPHLIPELDKRKTILI